MDEMQLETGLSQSFSSYSYEVYGSTATRSSWMAASTWKFLSESDISLFDIIGVVLAFGARGLRVRGGQGILVVGAPWVVLLVVWQLVSGGGVCYVAWGAGFGVGLLLRL
jgi:hypothetical protein